MYHGYCVPYTSAFLEQETIDRDQTGDELTFKGRSLLLSDELMIPIFFIKDFLILFAAFHPH